MPNYGAEEAPVSYRFADIAFTPRVKALQEDLGSRAVYAETEASGERCFKLGEDEAAFLADRDSFYMATVSETGWPYVQHRGGPRGFLKLVDDQTLAFADYRGNRQYISTGNLAADDRACLFLIDYPHRARLKIYAHVETVALDDEPTLTALVTMPDYKAKLERIFRLRMETFDWNCHQHITPRLTEQEISEVVRPLRDRLAQLETENAELRARLANDE